MNFHKYVSLFPNIEPIDAFVGHAIPLLDWPSLSLLSLDAQLVFRGQKKEDFFCWGLRWQLVPCDQEPSVVYCKFPANILHPPPPNPFLLTFPGAMPYNYNLMVKDPHSADQVVAELALYIPSMAEGGFANAEIKNIYKSPGLSGKEIIEKVCQFLDYLGVAETVLYDRAECIDGGAVKIPSSLMMMMEGLPSYYAHVTKTLASSFKSLSGETYIKFEQKNRTVAQKFIQNPILLEWAAHTIQEMTLGDVVACYPEARESFIVPISDKNEGYSLKIYLEYLRNEKNLKKISPEEHIKRVGQVFSIFFDGKKLVHERPMDIRDRKFLLAWNIVYNDTVQRRLHPGMAQREIKIMGVESFPTPLRINCLAEDIDAEISKFLGEADLFQARFMECLFNEGPTREVVIKDKKRKKY